MTSLRDYKSKIAIIQLQTFEDDYHICASVDRFVDKSTKVKKNNENYNALAFHMYSVVNVNK